jgi:cytochrome c biogenesis protein CcmG/thiol:disulfide interchange protein DsbE
LDLGVTGAPETYVIDREGVVRYRHIGVVDERVWQETLKPLYQSLSKN